MASLQNTTFKAKIDELLEETNVASFWNEKKLKDGTVRSLLWDEPNYPLEEWSIRFFEACEEEYTKIMAIPILTDRLQEMLSFEFYLGEVDRTYLYRDFQYESSSFKGKLSFLFRKVEDAIKFWQGLLPLQANSIPPIPDTVELRSSLLLREISDRGGTKVVEFLKSLDRHEGRFVWPLFSKGWQTKQGLAFFIDYLYGQRIEGKPFLTYQERRFKTVGDYFVFSKKGNIVETGSIQQNGDQLSNRNVPEAIASIFVGSGPTTDRQQND